ncbi:electron transfer flavoprotein subunit alpha [Methylobacterium indicum]|uniref:electron transfer flavoprotein subunit alpha/FixB family protein n=1 Tax=Methylobacterium indicum TaxID=1775910 RepID=UPI0007348388|nr:electron transfer flavoprotein subunit alpha/FixB family protein [Methylobacterium indicum]KTS25625.1 electron transfer flavoprotein subunit alpha [Methylobacterium indicum]KTS41453.1 electron transfer flavoprotein subunit alpha [Methylobacterium indicum]KTS51806.1 electron transfer flavoprotein subunit alpha [Methylobacterium indicum]
MTRPRRDPRAERAAFLVAPGEGARPRLDRTSRRDGGGRPRRDPRRERDGQRVPGLIRPRYDLSQVALSRVARLEAGPVHEALPRAAQAPVPKVVVLDAPAFLVLVVPDAAGGRLSTHDRQVLGAARVLAGREGGVALLALGPCEGSGPAGADRLVRLDDPDGHDPESYDPAGRAARVAAAIGELRPRHVLFPESPDGGDLARRVAVRLRQPLFSDVEAVAAASLARPARGRRVEQRAAPGLLATLSSDAVADYAGPPREAREIAGPAEAPVGKDSSKGTAILSATTIPADPATVPLGLASFVTAAGSGVTDLATFRQVVAALHATPGASRVLCDAGLMPRASQVGASGTVLAATCYVALGISGAPQHLQGVAGCEHVVAVNTDLHAAMIERAGLAIVQDAQAVMPALLRLLAQEAGRPGEAP